MADHKPTLTLKRQPAVSAQQTATVPLRSRSGTRARRVAQMTQQQVRQQASQQKKEPARTSAPPQTAPARAPAAENKQRSGRSASRKITDGNPVCDQTSAKTAAKTATKISSQKTAQDTVFQVFTPCPQGLEAALAAELHALGFASARAIRAGCHVQADWHGVQRLNLFSRLATRVLVKLSGGPVSREDDILQLARDTAWERWFGPEHRLRVDTSAVRSPMKSLHYCNLRAKDGICDRLRMREGARPDIDTVRPDVRVHLFLDERSATLYLDTSGESLFKRGWRLDKGAAPLRENLAAGMLALAGWPPESALLDPFCGSGTILIEAAYKALNVPPGILRRFAFERLRHHDRSGWFAYKDAQRDVSGLHSARLPAPMVGVDLDPAAIAAAQSNAQRAGLDPALIQFQVGDAREILPPATGTRGGQIVTNPPYGERLASEDVDFWADQFWPKWASHLKQHYSGWQAHIISSDRHLPQHLRLQAKRRAPLYNGALDCRLFSFDMVRARYEKIKNEPGEQDEKDGAAP